ncbi:hypothetical protein SAMN02927937_02589 [Paenimyroides aquimaris]|uniref:Lipoprotein n=1 Tax=Paenimyroides marinum TaxID=1159016 RepID=A0A1H6MMU5_9FLAO|nr:hypothetical protein [Paenimyroides aquimaris]SEH99211.1 hypothetical protein SAMN02927937_02589 [Paenimyroides aquimaris]
MKKNLMLCSIAFLAACTNEPSEGVGVFNNSNEVSTNQLKSVNSDYQPTIDDSIDQLFYDYVNSNLFINTTIAQNELNAKLRFNGDYDDIDTYYKLTTWVASNLDSTEFSDYDEAILEINTVLNLVGQKYEEFPEVFSYIEDAPISQVKVRVEKWLFPENTTTTTGPCEYTFGTCKDGVSDKYVTTLKELKDSEDGIEKYNGANNAENEYNKGMNKCKDDYKKSLLNGQSFK